MYSITLLGILCSVGMSKKEGWHNSGLGTEVQCIFISNIFLFWGWMLNILPLFQFVRSLSCSYERTE